MHAYSILLIGAWVLGSGIVAYVCDNLGRKLGKRRLSLWGLRPRHTAMVVTVLTGVSIAAVTVGFVALVSADARQALFEVISLSQQADTLKEKQRDLTLSNQWLQRETVRLTRAATEAGIETKRTTGAMNRAKKQRDQVMKELTSAQKRLAALETSRNALIAQVKERQARLQSLSSRLDESEVRLGLSQDEVGKSRSRLGEAQKRLNEVNALLAKSIAKTGDAVAQRQAAEKDRDAIRQELMLAQDSLRDARQELKDQEAKIQENQNQLDSLNDKLTVTQKLLNDEINRLTDIQSRLVNFRAESVIFSTGQEIARRVVYQPDDETEVSGELDKLLKSANDAARSQGAAGVTLLPAGAVSATGAQSLSDQEEKYIRQVLIRKIVADRRDVLIRALASANAVAGDTVQIILDVSPNLLAFHRGDLIVSRKIDGRLSQAKILEAMLDLLRNQVRVKALSVGLNPPPSGVVGEINWEMMLDTVRRIQKSRKPCEVRVLALADAWTADPLLIRFELRP